jgi:hypothetical protein
MIRAGTPDRGRALGHISHDDGVRFAY